MSNHRRLAAILFTDIVNYTAIMQENEQKAVSLIKHYNAVLERCVQSYDGKILNYYGDGSLCVFDSALDAVNCAYEMQKELQNEPIVPLRIGLHIGEVFFENGKALGDGVNVASRIQSIGQAHTIFFSREVYDKIRNHPEYKFTSLGFFEFKNVEDPIEVFALTNEGLIVPKREQINGKLKYDVRIHQRKRKRQIIFLGSIIIIAILITFLLLNRSSLISSSTEQATIAILPFKNVSVNKEQNDPFCTGVTLQLQKNLGLINELITIAPQSVEKYRDTKMNAPDIASELGGVRYIVQGSVERDQNSVEVFASLIDAQTGRQIWSDDFPGEMKNIFALQNDIAEKITTALKIKITPSEKEKISRTPTQNIKALDVYNEAMSTYIKMLNTLTSTWADLMTNKEAYDKYVQTIWLCDSALKLDTNLAEAYVLKANTLFYKHYHTQTYGRNQTANEQNKILDTIYSLTAKALQLNPDEVETYTLLSQYYEAVGKEDSVLLYLQKANYISPNSFEVNRNFGNYFRDRDPVKALVYCHRALRADPQSIWTPEVYNSIGFEYMTLCDSMKAESYFKKAYQLSNYHSASAVRALFQLGILNLELGRPDSVFKYSTESLQLGDYNALYQLAEANTQIKNYAKAEELYHRLWDSSQGEHVNEHRWAIALDKLGRHAEAGQLLNQAFEFCKKKYPISYDLAGMYAYKGDKANAYRILNQFDWGWGSPNLIQRDPLFDNLRNDKEFKDLLKKVLADKAKQREQVNELEAKGDL